MLAGYILISQRVTDSLIAAQRRGVDVRVLVDGAPVGGVPRVEAEWLDMLTAASVDVRVLPSDARYVSDENCTLVAHLDQLTDSEGLTLDAKVAVPGDRFGKVHTKGVVVDDEGILSSMNWNNQSARNPEVPLAFDGERIASYVATAFDADWKVGDRGLAVGLPVVL